MTELEIQDLQKQLSHTKNMLGEVQNELKARTDLLIRATTLAMQQLESLRVLGDENEKLKRYIGEPELSQILGRKGLQSESSPVTN